MMVRTACLSCPARLLHPRRLRRRPVRRHRQVTPATPAPTDPGTGESADHGHPATTSEDPPTTDDHRPAATTGTPTGAGTSTTDTGDDTTGDTGDETTDTGEPSPWDGEPLPDADDGEWQFIDFPDAKCRNGSSTGIGVRYGSGDGLVIYFEGGGACFNATHLRRQPRATTPATSTGSPAAAAPRTSSRPTPRTRSATGPSSTSPTAPATYTPAPPRRHAARRLRSPSSSSATPTSSTTSSASSRPSWPTRPRPGLGPERGRLRGGLQLRPHRRRLPRGARHPARRLRPADVRRVHGPVPAEAVARRLGPRRHDARRLHRLLPRRRRRHRQPRHYLGEKHSDQHLVLVSSLADETIRFFFGFGNNDCNALFPSTPADVFRPASTTSATTTSTPPRACGAPTSSRARSTPGSAAAAISTRTAVDGVEARRLGRRPRQRPDGDHPEQRREPDDHRQRRGRQRQREQHPRSTRSI
jgi:hypothetical protein